MFLLKFIRIIRKKSFLHDILYIFLATRIAIFFLALFFIGFSNVDRNITLYDAFSQWDGQWYLKVATEGYHWNGPYTQANVAFFPLYPLTAKILSLATHNLELSFLIVSNVSYFIFLIFLYKITNFFYDRETSIRTVWYLSIFPLSFIFSIFYNESLFLMMVAGAIYFAYKKRWSVAVLFAILGALARGAGLVLLPTLLFYYFKSSKKYKFSELIQILMIPVGIMLFSIYLWFKVGDFLAYIHILKAWKILYQNPLITIASTFELIKILPKYNYFTALSIFDLIILVFLFILLILSYKRLPKELFLFSILIFIFYISKSWDPTFFYPMGSTNRYLFEAFPLFLTLAKLGKNKFIDVSYVAFSLIFLGILSLSFFSGKWVF